MTLEEAKSNVALPLPFEVLFAMVGAEIMRPAATIKAINAGLLARIGFLTQVGNMQIPLIGLVGDDVGQFGTQRFVATHPTQLSSNHFHAGAIGTDLHVFRIEGLGHAALPEVLSLSEQGFPL